MGGRRANHPDLTAFANWGEVREYVHSDEGRDLKVMFNLVENYGVPAILEVCDASVNEDSADVIVSTAHKAKGREWNHVRIANDFKEPEEGADPSRPEMMLLYVAVTRAKLVLDNAALSWAA
jgi:superfamily I DNA/RNA helicase